MKLLIALLAFPLISPLSEMNSKAVYGNDNRKEVYEIQEDDIRDIASLSNVALVSKNKLTYDPIKGIYKVKNPKTLNDNQVQCENEPFVQQQVLAYCSGFIVGDDKVATAGHCIPNFQRCRSSVFIVGFYLDETSKKSPTEFPEENVFSCDSFVRNGKKDDDIDFSILRTDRSMKLPVLVISNNLNLTPKETNLALIGHPSGLPTKISGDAEVINIDNNNHKFQANVDAFGGNSGSAIINQNTLKVEGILVSGKTDYIRNPQKHCSYRASYPHNSFSGETAVKASVLLPHL